MWLKSIQRRIIPLTILLIVLLITDPELSQAKDNSLTVISIHEQENQFANYTVVRPGKVYLGNFTNTSPMNNWLIPNLTTGLVVYFCISPITPLTFNELEIFTFNPNRELFDHQPTLTLSKYLGVWQTTMNGDWLVKVNSTISINASYEFYVYIPEYGYNYDTAISLSSSIQERNFSIYHEVHFWKLELNLNQIGRLVIAENSPNLLKGAQLVISGSSSLKNPVVEETINTGTLNVSWVAGQQGTYYVVLQHSEEIQTLGSYNISIVVDRSGYNFETAVNIPFNNSVVFSIETAFPAPKEYYFSFIINHSSVSVFINIWEEYPEVSRVLDFAQVDIYDSGRQSPILTYHENLQEQDGIFNITFEAKMTGRYFLVITLWPSLYPETGNFIVSFHYLLPSSFVWNPISIIITLLCLIAFPLFLIYNDYKGKWLYPAQWTVEMNISDTFKYLRSQLTGKFSISEVPDESLLIRVKGIMRVKTFILVTLIESSEFETSVVLKRLRRKFEFVVHFLAAILIYDIINIISFGIFSTHFLPFYVPNTIMLLTILAIPTSIGIIVVFFINVISFLSFQNIVNTINHVIDNISFSEDMAMNPQQLQRRINYVRVLWNQAKHAYKDKRYNFFVIKADTAIKNLVEIRYLQLIPRKISSDKPDFQTQVKKLREWGFDLPSDKKIIKFRNLRNQIVHSSVTLDQKDSITCFDYYSNFISRLGLRAN